MAISLFVCFQFLWQPRTLLAPPQNPTPKKQECKNQECLASYKKKLIACGKVRCKRRVHSIAASPREYLERRAAKNVISPPKTPPKKQECKNQECLASYKKKLIACGKVRCKRRVHSIAASPREYLERRAAKNVISPPKTPQNPTAVYKPWSNYCLLPTAHCPLTPDSSLLTPHSSLLTPHSTLLTPHSSLLTTHYSLLTTHYSLLTTHFSLLTSHFSLLTSHFSLLASHYSLLTTHSSLLTPHSSLLTPHSSLLTPSY